MEIVEYLAELIQNRKQVGIAGLGTLYKSKIPGRYDANAHAFLPPSHTLHFSTELLEKELLAAYISTRRNISVDSANYFIEQFSNQAVQELAEKNETQLGNLGKLSSVNGDIVFEPSGEAKALISTEYFGLPKIDGEPLDEPGADTVTDALPPIHIEQVEDEFVEDLSSEEEEKKSPEGPLEEHITLEEEPGELQKPEEQTELQEPEGEETPKEQAEPEVQPISEADTLQEEEVESVPVAIETSGEVHPEEELYHIVEENKLEEENPGREDHRLAALLPEEINHHVENYRPIEMLEENRSPSYLKISLAIVLVLFIGGLAYYLYPKMMTANQIEIEESQQLDSLTYLEEQMAADSAAYRDSIRNAVLALTDTMITDTMTADTVTTAVVAAKPSVTTYEIVIGSLANMKDAKKFIAQIKAKGITGWVVDSLSGGKIRVSVASFTERETAVKERRRIVKELKDPSIYIYTNKPKR